MPVSPADLVLSCQLTCRQRSKTRPTFVIKVLRRPVESALLASWATSPAHDSEASPHDSDQQSPRQDQGYDSRSGSASWPNEA
jgi:hypothetical protein